MANLKDCITRELYEKICIGLFEEHKIIYALLICSSIKRKAELIHEVHWSLLLRGAGIYNKTNQPEKPEELSGFVTDAAWDLIYCLQQA